MQCVGGQPQATSSVQNVCAQPGARTASGSSARLRCGSVHYTGRVSRAVCAERAVVALLLGGQGASSWGGPLCARLLLSSCACAVLACRNAPTRPGYIRALCPWHRAADRTAHTRRYASSHYVALLECTPTVANGCAVSGPPRCNVKAVVRSHVPSLHRSSSSS
jgi:hypothetical protein